LSEDTISPLKLDAAYRHAAELIGAADALIIAAGAGMGVDSGLPDFRGNEGFWKAYPALAKAQLNFTDVANPRTFLTDVQMGWGFYGHRLNLYRKTVPHAGFNILLKWAERMRLGSRVFTSNVDGQFQKAGFAPDQIHECHGSIHHLQCMEPCISGVWGANDFVPDVDDKACRLRNEPPACPVCGGPARPNILMFGDWDWSHDRVIEQRAREKSWLDSLVNGFANVVVVEMGAGAAIPSVRHFSYRMSQTYSARIIRINTREPAVPSTNDVGIALPALDGLRGIDERLTH